MADFVVQKQQAVWHTMLLGLVSARTHTPFLATNRLVLKHAFCHFLVSPTRMWSKVYLLTFAHFHTQLFSTLEVLILPRAETCAAYPGSDRL